MVRAVSLGREIKLNLVADPGGGFKLADESGEVGEVIVDSPLQLDNSFEDKEFDVFFVVKKNLLESDIYQLYDSRDSSRIGWCIPVGALDSKEHDYAHNPHFLKYAFVAIKESLGLIGGDFYARSLDLDSRQSFGVSDIFHPYTAVVIISREKLIGKPAFEIDSVMPTLHSYGYAKLTLANPDDLVLTGERPQGARLTLKFVSPHLNCKVISSLLHSAFAYESKSILCFFYVYQVIELILDKIFEAEQAKVINELIQASGDSARAKDALEKVQRITSEKKRIQLLINEYSSTHSQLNNLKDSCNNLLRKVGRAEGSAFEEYFYSIRNFIFHQYRDFPNEEEGMLRDIVDDAREWLPELLGGYAVP